MSADSFAPQPTGWLHLPDELKLLILEPHLSYPKIMDHKLAPIIIKMRLVPLLDADIPGLADFATHVFFNLNTFNICAADIYWGQLPPVSTCREIRHLEFEVSSLHMGLSGDLSSLSDTKDDTILKLAAERWRSDWSSNFAQLHSLRIMLNMARMDERMLLVEGRGFRKAGTLKEHVKALSWVVANMRPEKLKVTLIWDEYCPRKKGGHQGTKCECVKQLEADAQAELMAAAKK